MEATREHKAIAPRVVLTMAARPLEHTAHRSEDTGRGARAENVD